MGQNPSIPDTVDTIQFEFKKHAKVFSEIHNLEFDEFIKSILELNELSRKCVDSKGNKLVFAVKKGSDTTMFWKATVRIACVKVNMTTRCIEKYNLLNLKQFLAVFKTFQTHLQALITSEDSQQRIHDSTTSMLMEQVDQIAQNSEENNSSSHSTDECIICMDSKTDILLPCAHSFCTPCIDQWSQTHKKCPVCAEGATSSDESWVLSEIPKSEEVNEEIVAELMKLSEKGGEGK